jgi:hypothetical protein
MAGMSGAVTEVEVTAVVTGTCQRAQPNRDARRRLFLKVVLFLFVKKAPDSTRTKREQ